MSMPLGMYRPMRALGVLAGALLPQMMWSSKVELQFKALLEDYVAMKPRWLSAVMAPNCLS